MPLHFPKGRSVISVTGEDAEHFLQNLVTCDVTTIPAGSARACALLAPQGKVMFDFLIMPDGDGGYLIDIDGRLAADFLRRLTMYKLRAKVEIAEADESLAAISWQDDSTTGGRIFADSRFPAELGVSRHYGAAPESADDAAEWTALRIAHGIAESGSDFEAGDAFPHDISLDQTGGVDFRKGCYVGQEVVSRMQHRGTARRRIVIVQAETALPASGTALEAGGKTVGHLGSVAGNKALAIVRLDRAKAAMDAGTPITAEGLAVTLSLPPGVTYSWPDSAKDGGD
ncbi:YgfZ/GcvT domain-containing protein [Oricola thermophila]|uniref:Folate-binding protein YgfZ n=1 Tax=Oricola thermophila TaxID=2742145 RepID=A0A6N1VC50_9HYPH|nr:folate-binding protein YgfZ [Oricola thermophila]QKV18460.1 folate-binding protein YgfZ [Oricola thermophila]